MICRGWATAQCRELRKQGGQCARRKMTIRNRVIVFLLAHWQKYQECCSKRDISGNERFWHKQLSSPGTPDPPLLRTKSEGVERSELNGIQSRLSARGHQEYRVYCRSRSGSSARTTHRSACTSCSSERVTIITGDDHKLYAVQRHRGEPAIRDT